MKSLKRTLSLVLVLVMVLGLFGIASATSFKDDANILYKEAVDVMTGIGAINGYADGTFNPKGTITRAEAAKMVAYAVLGADVAANLPLSTSSFSDVTVAGGFSWAIPSIQYLVRELAINGRGDGTFDPNGQVTGYEIGKMLLVCLGIDGEYTGSGWDLNVAIAANKAGIFDGRATAANALGVAASREECALYTFNTLIYTDTTKTETTTKYVLYALTNTYLPVVALAGNEYASVAEGISAATTAAGASKFGIDYNFIATTKTSTKYVGSIADNVYGLTEGNAPDDFGRPNVRVWNYKGKAISSTYTVSPVKTYYTTVTGAKIFADLGMTTNQPTATTYTDGKYNSTTSNISYNAATAYIGGNGTVTEVYVDASGVVTLVVINSYIGTVTYVAPATAVSKETVNLVAATTKLGTFTSGSIAATGFAANDAVVYTVAQTAASTYSVKSIAEAEVKTLAPTSRTGSVASTASFVANGTTYYYSAKLNGGNGTVIGDLNAKDFYFDSYGFVIDVDGATVPGNYAVVLAAGNIGDGFGNTAYNVRLLLPDGTTVDVRADDADFESHIGEIVSYTLDTVGRYVYANQTGVTLIKDFGAGDTAPSLTLTKGVSTFTWVDDSDDDGGLDPRTNTFYANSNTTFLVRSGAPGAYTYAAYTGIANVPSLSGAAVGGVFVNSLNGFAQLVYVANATATTAASDLIFVPVQPTNLTTTAQGSYYEANVFVNGTMTTLKLASNYAVGLYTSMVTNSAGVATLGTAGNNASAAANLRYLGGTLTVGGNSYTAASDIKVFIYNSAAGTVAASTTAALPTSLMTRNFFYTMNSTNTQVTSIWVDVAQYSITNSNPALVAGTSGDGAYTVSAPTVAFVGQTVTVTVTWTGTTISATSDTVAIGGVPGAPLNVVFPAATFTSPAELTTTFVMPASNVTMTAASSHT